MSFGGGQANYNPNLVSTAAPAYTPTRADNTVVQSGPVRSASPALSTSFKSLVGGAGGLGRKPGTAKRSLIGGE